MNNRIIKLKAADGFDIEFVISDNPPAGGMKYVYFSPKKDYVVAFYHKKPDTRSKLRLESIVEKYRNAIYNQVGGDYWKDLFCWPERIVEWEDKIGIVVPAYAPHFFFQIDSRRKGKEKQGKWFSSAKLFKELDVKEKGNFLNYLKISLNLSRAVRRMHSAGLAHSDLSYANVLIDPTQGKVCLIDIDGLVVPGKYPPEVLGTPDFIAPEVLCDETKKVVPSQNTDKHALAVLIYMYLLHRHPLRGGKFFDVDSDEEEKMLLGVNPVYIEHPSDSSNKNMKREYGDDFEKCKPWSDIVKFSAEKIVGPFISDLFKRAFIEGLKNPMKRPSANEWEIAIVKTTDRLLPCSNSNCVAKWFVYDNSCHPVCPFCKSSYKGLLPKLEFYSCKSGTSSYQPENYQLVIFSGQPLRQWHVTKKVFPNEKLSSKDNERKAYFQFHNGKWLLVNEKLTSLYEITADNEKILKKPGEAIILEDNKKILLSTEDGGRLVYVQLAGK